MNYLIRNVYITAYAWTGNIQNEMNKGMLKSHR